MGNFFRAHKTLAKQGVQKIEPVPNRSKQLKALLVAATIKGLSSAQEKISSNVFLCVVDRPVTHVITQGFQELDLALVNQI